MEEAKISIVIPVYNEQEHIAELLGYLTNFNISSHLHEILVVDGGSTDLTVAVASAFDVTLCQSAKGRAAQMNFGARKASGNVLYFLHADTLPPENFIECLVSLYEKGNKAGCFRLRFNNRSLFLAFFSWCTRFNFLICRGGDQSLYITKELFEKLDGFNENYVIYEDSELIGRIYKTNNFSIIPDYVTTSARRYDAIGMFRLQYHFGVIHLKNALGADPEQLYDYYRRKVLA
ncbi:glycosyltransferase [Euzebyella marina]|uniref:Glycosyltransferase n=1 Tax=Euzebyella marina TaxID=1761453 RepID=A0A3G2LA77_9FLAO|nr:TIGR04283 family arsenosugar biosynthesis glycosyltransferase [Euzebyella marina]AYN69165.1 glycosyltransferase [Euzebyella marina]